jgi:hypothetical protein
MFQFKKGIGHQALGIRVRWEELEALVLLGLGAWDLGLGEILEGLQLGSLRFNRARVFG